MTAVSPPPLVDSFDDALRSGYDSMVLRGSSADKILSSAPEGSPEARAYQK